MPDTALFVSVTGRVQGVGYRMWAQREARTLGLRGWVRNEPDGSVAALVGGPEDAVSRMLALLKSGPRAAAVNGVATHPADLSDLPSDFRQIR